MRVKVQPNYELKASIEKQIREEKNEARKRALESLLKLVEYSISKGEE